MYDRRAKQIEEILGDLDNIRKTATAKNLYAIDANIEFFKAVKSVGGYLQWLLFRAPKTNREKLLEVNDLLPKYDEEVYKELIRVENKDFPGLIKPLVRKIVNFIISRKGLTRIMDLGSGGGELEKQIIGDLMKKGHSAPTVLFAVDKSLAAHLVARDNLKTLPAKIVSFVEQENIDGEFLFSFRPQTVYTVVFCKNDIFTLGQVLGRQKIDMVFHCLFSHHLDKQQRKAMENLYPQLTKNVLEYDGYRSFLHIILHTIEAWHSPIFLNATVVSDLRYDTKKQIKQRNKAAQFFGIGTYLLEYKY